MTAVPCEGCHGGKNMGYVLLEGAVSLDWRSNRQEVGAGIVVL